MTVQILRGHVLDRLSELENESVHCVVTSPPYYGLRDYGIEPQVWPDAWRGSLGLEPTLEIYLDHMVEVCREIRRVLRKDGTFWLNIGDSYAANPAGNKQGSTFLNGRATDQYRMDNYRRDVRRDFGSLKPKDLMLIPSRLALRLQADGWWVRSEIIWAKRAPMPESITDRPTSAHEKIWLLTKSARYFYDAEAVKEDAEPASESRYKYDFTGTDGADAVNDRRTVPKGPREFDGKRNLRNFWLLGPSPFPEAHFATFPPELPRRAILAGCPRGGMVLDPFLGSGTTALVADQLQRDCIGIDLSPSYADMAAHRICDDAPLFVQIAMTG